MYPELFIAPMREELTRFGVKELRTAQDVDDAVTGQSGTLMLVVNSVCGCAAGKARPGVALQHGTTPDDVATLRRRRRRGAARALRHQRHQIENRQDDVRQALRARPPCSRRGGDGPHRR